MRKFESSHKDESRAQSADSSKAYRKRRAFYCSSMLGFVERENVFCVSFSGNWLIFLNRPKLVVWRKADPALVRFQWWATRCLDGYQKRLSCLCRAEQSYVNGRIANLVVLGSFWIGGNRIDENHGWEWSNLTPFNFFYWADGKTGYTKSMWQTIYSVLIIRFSFQWYT